MVTKNDLKRKLSNYLTKNDLNIALVKLREDIAEDTADIICGFIETIDKRKDERKDIDRLDKRVTQIEKKLAL